MKLGADWNPYSRFTTFAKCILMRFYCRDAITARIHGFTGTDAGDDIISYIWAFEGSESIVFLIIRITRDDET